MFISFLMPSRYEGIPARHLLVLYKQLDALGREHAAFIGERDYFQPPAELQAAGRLEWQPSWRQMFEYEPPGNLDGVTFRTLPDDLLTARLARMQSRWRLYGQLVTRPCAEVEAAIDTACASIPNASAAEAIVTFANLPALSRVAARRRLPLVHTHFGALRKPDYAMTGYWDLRGVNSNTDAARRYRRFRREARHSRFTPLTQEELLHTVRRTPMPDGPQAAGAPYPIGLALQGEENAYVHGFGGLDLLSAARQRFDCDQILFRTHPGALTTYSNTLGVVDTSGSSAEFILKCRTVMTVNSGVALEAMLLGRRCAVLGDSPLRIAADASIETALLPPRRDHLLALNFLVFGYLVPYSMMFDPDYMRWRLTDPPEIEIVHHHQRWYRRQLTVAPSSSLTLSTATKLLDAVTRRERRLPLVVFGAGACTPTLVDHLRGGAFDLLGLFDNDRARWGSSLLDLPIGPPMYRDDAVVLVSSLTHADDIVRQLGALGYPAERILRLAQAAA